MNLQKLFGNLSLIALCLGSISPSRASAIAAGGSESLLIKNDGTAWATGSNTYGNLGTGNTIRQYVPVQIMSGVADGSVHVYHSLYLKTDGTVWATGLGDQGRLGLGNVIDQTAPVQVPIANVMAVAAGLSHSLFLKTDGSVWACGGNAYGQLGDGTKMARFSPVQVMTGVKAICAGAEHSLFLKTDGTVWGAGSNYRGELAAPSAGTTTSYPTPIQIISGVSAISSFYYHNLFLKTDGTVWANGSNFDGQLGNGTTSQQIIPVQTMSGVSAIAAGRGHSLFLKTDGTVWGCGSNSNGEVGNGSNSDRVDRLTPTPILSGVSKIAAGAFHSLYIKTDGSFWANGSYYYGALGIGWDGGNHLYEFLPVQIWAAPAPLAPQTISFPTIADRLVSSPPFTLAASVPSGLPVTFSLISGPTTLNGSTLTLTGSPGTVIVRASQGGNATYAAAPPVDRSFMVSTTTSLVPVVTSSTTVTGDAGQAFSHTFAASNGPNTFSLHSGSLPPGLTLNPATGVLAGTVATPGAYSFIVKATNASSSATFTQTLTFNSTSTQFAPAALAAGMQISFDGVVEDSLEGEYGESKTVRVTSATSFQGGTYTYSKTGANTATLSYELNDSGEVENGTIQVVFTSATGGTYNSSGSYQGSWDGEEYFGDFTGEGTFDFVGPVTPSIVTPGLLPASTAGTSYSQALSASDGTPPYKWSLASGKLPVGLKVNSAGSITGTAKTGGLFSFLLRVTDKNKRVTTKAFSLVVNAPPLIATRTPLAAGTAGTAYGLNLVATNGLEPYTWSIAAGTLPPGLSLSGTGTISGTPIEQSAASFTVQVAGSNGLSASQTMALTTNAPPLISTPDTLPNGSTGSPYSQSLTASGGAPAYAFSISSGKLPAGLKLAKTGIIAGKPTLAGPTTFTVKVTGKNKLFSTRTFTLTVEPAAAGSRLALAGIADDEADRDADGIPNLLEEVFGGDPRSNSRHLLPTVSVDGRDLIFTYRRQLAAAAITQVIEHSANLAPPWTPVVHGQNGVIIVTTPVDATTEQVTATIPSGGTTAFVRLRANR